MDVLVTQQEQKNKRRGMVTSMIVHILLILLALWPFLQLPDPPPGQEGILVNLGLPDEGQGDDNAGPSEPVVEEQEEEPVEETSEPEETEPVDDPEPEPEDDPTPVEPEPTKEVITDDNSEEIALKKKEEEKKKKEAKEKAERERKEKARKEREAKEKAEKAAAEAKKKADAAKFKDELSGLFGDGDGKGKTGKPGNQGDPDGDPNSDKLDGISTGSGRVGGGLGDRGVVKSHTPTDNSQETGTVVVEVCVNENGSVVSAKVTQKGTTSSSSKLRNLALKSAKKWRFKEGIVDKQCGTITYNFKLK